MATKRFTDAEKWKDPFFENLNNNFKLIWLYLLDDCDNAGIWNKSIKRLNFHCNTSISQEELLEVFKKRLQPITEDKWFIPKFMEFQYGVNWLDSGNKAVTSAKKKLEELKVIENNTLSNSVYDTLSIPYEYPIDTGKDKDKVKDKDNIKDNIKDKEEVKEEVKANSNRKEKNILMRLLDDLIQYEDIKRFKLSYQEIEEYGGINKVYNTLEFTESQIKNWTRKINNVISSKQLT